MLTLNRKTPNFVSVANSTFVYFSKANLVAFTEFTENIFTAPPIPTDVIIGKRRFRKLIAAATSSFISAGKIAEIRPKFPNRTGSFS